MVEKCMQHGFDPRTQDAFGNTLFHVAAQNGNKKIAKLSIKYGGALFFLGFVMGFVDGIFNSVL